MESQYIYFYNGKILKKENLSFKEKESGIIGMFSVHTHATNPDTIVFYKTTRKEFHHPTKRNYEYQNHGFQEFLREETNAHINTSGGMIGNYAVFNKNLYFRIHNEHNQRKLSFFHQCIIDNLGIENIIELGWKAHEQIEKEAEQLELRKQIKKEETILRLRF